MSQMKELYEKVAKDGSLQAKFNAIINGAEQAGKEATNQALLAFAKEEGFDVSLEEMQEFFQNLAQPKDGELSDLELDMVAGGKNQRYADFSILTVLVGCVVISIAGDLTQGYCPKPFQ